MLRATVAVLARRTQQMEGAVAAGAAQATAMEVDGSMLEGGGQILRVSIALSAVLQKSLHIHSIRANRSKTGLRPQHLAGVQLVSQMCQGRLVGGKVGSSEITHTPSSCTGVEFSADPGTAGSIALLLQASVPVACFAKGPVTLALRGGTNAEMAPQMDYITRVFSPIASRMGVDLDINVVKRGYFPKGGGEVVARVNPLEDTLSPIVLEDRGEIAKITGRSFVAGPVPHRVATETAAAAERVLRKALGDDIPIDIDVVVETKQDAPLGAGSGIILECTTTTGCILGGTALGKRGVPAKKVGEDAATELLVGIAGGGCVDEYLMDQLVIFMGLAKGRSRVLTGPLSLHSETAIALVGTHSGADFTVTPKEGGGCVVECEGVGFSRKAA